MIPTTLAIMMLSGAGAVESAPSQPVQGRGPFGICDTEGVVGGVLLRGGGMISDGWDGEGANATTLYFHVENTSGDLGGGQRTAVINALAAWANVVQIQFVEIGVANINRSIDFRFATGNHCAVESDECGDPDCPFDGSGGTIAHAGFPPGASSQCVDPMSETWAGNVHFDDGDLFETDTGNPADGYSMTLVAAHEIGHAIGLVHDIGGGGPHIMRPTIGWGDVMQLPSPSDIAHLQQGYATGAGGVTTFETNGIWVNASYMFTELGLPGDPFNTIPEAINALPPFNTGVTIHLIGGSYPPVTISQPCTITAEFNAATIGQ